MRWSVEGHVIQWIGWTTRRIQYFTLPRYLDGPSVDVGLAGTTTLLFRSISGDLHSTWQTAFPKRSREWICPSCRRPSQRLFLVSWKPYGNSRVYRLSFRRSKCPAQQQMLRLRVLQWVHQTRRGAYTVSGGLGRRYSCLSNLLGWLRSCSLPRIQESRPYTKKFGVLRDRVRRWPPKRSLSLSPR